MAREVGDLWPQSSGSASLGAEMTNGGVINSRPFAHIHCNSGVLHDPLSGTSGVIKFGNAIGTLLINKGFGFSFDGGLTYPLVLGGSSPVGQVGLSSLANVDLVLQSTASDIFIESQQAIFIEALDGINITDLDNGNITLTTTIGSITGLSNGGSIVFISDTDALFQAATTTQIKSTAGNVAITSNIGSVNTTATIDITDSTLGAITHVASGQNSFNAFAGSGKLEYRFGPHESWHIKQSHSSTGGPANDGFWPIPHSGQIRAMVASGSIQKINGAVGPNITIIAGDGYTTVTTNAAANQITIDTSNIVSSINGEFDAIAISGVNGIAFTNTAGSAFIINGAALSGLNAQYICGNEIALLSHPALVPRGILLKYPVGARITNPEDAINVEHGYGIAVSGFSSTPQNISSYGISMLTPNALDVRGSGSRMPNVWLGINNSRQSAHLSTSGVLRISTGSGIIVNDCKTTFASSGIAALNISGIYSRPTAQLDLGDTYMMAHSAIENIGVATQVDSLELARARSLGLATAVYNTGSGIINISNGSGIMQCLNTAAMSVTLVTQTLPLVAATPCSDMNYHIGTGANSGNITLLTPGLYKADYKVLSNKTIGTTPQTVQTNATLNGSNVLGSFINSFHYNSTTAAQNSSSCSVLFNANAGDIFRLISSSTLDGADNCTVGVRGALLVIQKIGPKRSTF